MNNKKVEYNAKYQTGKEDGFIILDKRKFLLISYLKHMRKH